MIYLLGLVLAIASLTAAVIHLAQDMHNYWDFVAFVCVFGGTIAVALMTFPWQYRRLVASSMLRLFSGQRRNDGQIVLQCIDFVKGWQSGNQTYQGEVRTLAGEVLRDGSELMTLGFSQDRVREILDERIHQSFERHQKVSQAMRSLSKYPPAFGLAGTVLGLVTLMRKVSEGADAKQTGFMMAVALMATFYGLLTSNLLVNPAGENMAKTALAEKKQAEIALHAVLLCMQKASLLEAQEIINSYVTKDQRVNLLGEMAEAA